MDRQLLRRLRRAKVVSFDVFDTAVLRPFAQPKDMFWLMQVDVERVLGRKRFSFHTLRPEAERAARQAGRGAEVTLTEVYANLSERMGFDAIAAEKIAKLEIEAEQFVCRQNPFIHSIYRRCLEEGKRVAFISDTYLPETAISDILRGCGYATYDALFVSSAVGKTKASGELHVEARSRLPYRAWLHIGDNRHSDVAMAGEAGMIPWHYPRCGKVFRSDPRAAGMWKNCATSSLGASVVQGLIANRNFSVRPRAASFQEAKIDWQDLGYSTAGPLFVGFTEWLIEEATARDLQALYFLSREGRIMQHAYQALASLTGSVVENHYLFASRRALNLAFINRIDETAVQFLISEGKMLTVAQIIERWGLDWRVHTSAFRAAGVDNPHQKISEAGLRRLLIELSAPICERAREERVIMLDYLLHSGLKDGRRVGLVDIGWNGTMQRSLTGLLRRKGRNPFIFGLYLGTWERANLDHLEHPHAAYLFRLGQPAMYAELASISFPVIEHIFAATEGTVLRIRKDASGRFVPVRREAEDEAYRNESIVGLQRGAMQFVNDYVALKQRFPGLGLRKEVAVAQLERLLRFPTRAEARFLGDIPYATDFSELVKVPIARPPHLLQFFTGPRAFRKAYKRSYWQEGRDARSSSLQRALYRLLTRKPIWAAPC